MKVKIIVSLCLVAALLCACSGGDAVQTEKRTAFTEEKTIYTEKYTIYKEEETWYMEFPPEKIENPSGNDSGQSVSGAMVAKFYPDFDSIYDMQDQIITGTLSDNDIALLKEDSRDGKLEICNPYDLQYLTLPDGVELDHVWWRGDSYGMKFYGKGVSGSVECFNEETFNTKFEASYVNFLKEDFSIISDKTVSDRNAREVHYMTKAAELRVVYYELKIGQASLYVLEHYVINYFGSSNDRTSNTVPKYVEIFWNDGEHNYAGAIWTSNERPSVEWLSSFQLVPM